MNGPREPAIDHAGGIARLMGDRALFARVLARFGEAYRGAAAGILHALEAGDSALALRLAHTLKGAAGMIEARPLMHAAHALEQRLRSGGEVPQACLAQLEQALAQVLRDIDTVAPGLPLAPHGAPATPAAAPDDALAHLATLLDDGNGDAVDLVREAEAALRVALGDERYGRLGAAIECFDFEAALATLKERAG